MKNHQPASPRFSLSFAVWGRGYVDTFVNLVLANLLSPNLIPVCLEKYALSCLIYTTPRDAEIIQKNIHFQKLNNLIPIEICPIIDGDLLNMGNKWDVKGVCQSRALSHGIQNNLVNIFINSDVLMSDGSLLHCCDLINSGVKVVNILELARVKVESIKPDLLNSYYNSSTNALSLDSKTLVQLGNKHLHEIGKNLFWKKSPSSTWPSIIYWNVGENCILAKSFHLHPMAIDARHLTEKLPEQFMSDDGGLIEFLGFSAKDIYTCTDSAKLTSIELSFEKLDIVADSLPEKNNGLNLWKWVRKYSSFDSRRNFRRHVFYFIGSANLPHKQEVDRLFRDLYLIYFLFFLLDIKNVCFLVVRKMARITGLIYLYRLVRQCYFYFYVAKVRERKT